MFKLDDLVRTAGVQAQGQTPSQQPNDNLSSQRSFYDGVMNSIEYYDSKIRRKFKTLEFPGVVLNVRNISDILFMERTSLTFAKEVIPMSKQEKIYEVFLHIPEITGLLPQPTFSEMRDQYLEKNKNDPDDFERKKYNMITSRYPRFYIADKYPPRIFQVWKAKFPDENFFYYGILQEMIQNEGMVGGEAIRIAGSSILQEGTALS